MERYLLLIVLIFLLICGCSGSISDSDPVQPDQPANPQTPQFTDTATRTPGNSHFLLLYNHVSIDFKDASDFDVEIIPIRQTALHFNILTWLENGPCFDCFKIISISKTGEGTFLIDVRITHPFSDADLTAFDVRGIMMFNASHQYPAFGLSLSDRSLGDGALVNPDGYTSLYNGSTEGHWIEGYTKGNLASVELPDSLVNGFKRHVSDYPANTRNALHAGDSATVTYEIDLPDGPFIFGYAVDANWALPVNTPVEDPIVDFGADANCLEAWKIDITQIPVGDELTDCSGQATLLIDIYDWQGKDDEHPVMIECPELFNGTIEGEWVGDEEDFTRYEATILNLNYASAGEYLCLVRKEASENDPINKPWLDLSAYQVSIIEVIEYTNEPPTASTMTNELSTYVGNPITFDGSSSHDNDCEGVEITKHEWDWENDGTFDDEGIEIIHSWDTIGTYYIQLRVTDDEGSTAILDQPMIVNIHEGESPIANAEVNTHHQFLNEPVEFYGFYSNDPDGYIVKHEWDWDADGVYDEIGSQVSHSWDVEGTYPVQLRVTDNDGLTDELDEPIEITIEGVNPFHLEDVTPVWLNFDPVKVCINGDYAYVLSYHNAIHIFSLADPENPVWVHWVEMPDTPLNIEIVGDLAYIAANSADVQILNIESPESAYISGEIITPDNAVDVKISGNFAYVLTSSTSSSANLQVINIETPEQPVIVQEVPISQKVLELEIASGYAYVSAYHAYDSEVGYIYIIDISPPESAVLINIYDEIYVPRGISARDGYVFVAEYDTEWDWDGVVDNSRFSVIDVDPAESPVKIKTIYIDYPTGTTLSGDYVFMTSSSGYIQIFNVSDPGNASSLGKYDVSPNPRALDVTDDYAYIVGECGLDVVDINPIGATEHVNLVPTLSNVKEVEMKNGYAFLTNWGTGVQVLNVTNPDQAWIVQSVPTEGIASAITVSGDYAYVSTKTWYDEFYYQHDLQIIDIEPPESSYILTSIPVFANDTAVSDGYAYTVGTEFHVIDVTQPDSPIIVSSIPLPEEANAIAVEGSYAYVVDGEPYVLIIDISSPTDPYIFNTVDIPVVSTRDICANNGYAFIAQASLGLGIVDVNPPGDSNYLGNVYTYGSANGAVLFSGYAAVAGSALSIIDLDPIGDPYIIQEHDLPFSANDVAVNYQVVCVACANGSLVILTLQ